MSGWVSARDEYSEPLAGCCHPRGSLEHAIQEAPGPVQFPNTVTRRSLCGVGNGGMLRNFERYFDPLVSRSGRKICPRCVSVFAVWWADQIARSAESRR